MHPAILLALLAAGRWLNADAQPQLESAPLVAPFSTAKPGGAMPAGWKPVLITEAKKRTQYDLVADGDATVLHARAEAAASGLGYAVKFDPRSAPQVAWRWKMSQLIEGADNSVGAKEDSPVRLVFHFDGDRSRLPLTDRAFLSLGSKIAGQDAPYATLMYIWSNHAPVGTVIRNPHTGRVRMIVASSGTAGVGAWQALQRNLADDYRRAFGEEAGLLTAVGVLTDTDNTGATVDAWYGDIRFLPATQ